MHSAFGAQCMLANRRQTSLLKEQGSSQACRGLLRAPLQHRTLWELADRRPSCSSWCIVSEEGQFTGCSTAGAGASIKLGPYRYSSWVPPAASRQAGSRWLGSTGTTHSALILIRSGSVQSPSFLTQACAGRSRARSLQPCQPGEPSRQRQHGPVRWTRKSRMGKLCPICPPPAAPASAFGRRT